MRVVDCSKVGRTVVVVVMVVLGGGGRAVVVGLEGAIVFCLFWLTMYCLLLLASPGMIFIC